MNNCGRNLSTTNIKPTPNYSNDEMLELAILGLLLKKLSPLEKKISVAEILTQLRNLNIQLMEEQLRSMLDSIIKTYGKKLGLVKMDREHLMTLGAVHWYMRSIMYEKLVKSEYKELTSLFAEQVKDLSEKITEPRLLVDAGSTTYKCLFDDNCARLRDSVSSLITNNLLVAFRWQQDFKKGGPVTLIGGAPDLDTAATVDHEKLDQWLSAKSRRPQISLLSWHYIVPDVAKNNVELYTKDQKEMEVKKRAMEITENIVYVVFSAEKITNRPPIGAKKYSIRDLLEVQKKKYFDKKSGEVTRQVYLITNLKKPNTKLQKQIVDIMKRDEFCKNHVNLVYLHSEENKNSKID